MAKGQSFIGLTAYLEKCGKDEIELSFSEVERILGFQLPDSAYLHQPYWSNSGSHPIASGWLNAGYLSQHIDMKGQTVEFVKKDHQSHQIQEEAGKTAVMSREKCAALALDEAVRCIRTYFNETVKDPHGRYMSWGMYRGSSFLLQKDYKVHIPVVKILLEKKYDPLVGISAEGLTEDANLDLLDEVSERTRRAYAVEQPSFEGAANKATDTLVTKILLGTLGCVPAYDRYYVQTVKRCNISAGVYSRKSVRDVAVYYLSHKDEFESLREELSTCGTRYPAMKLMDMCMWQLAFETDKRKEP